MEGKESSGSPAAILHLALFLGLASVPCSISYVVEKGYVVDDRKVFQEPLFLRPYELVFDLQELSKMLSRTAKIPLVSSHPEVYEPCDDSFALVDALLADRTNLVQHHPSICMEIGCGSGYVITSLAVMLGHEGSIPYYIATDINPHAIRVTRETMDAHGVYAELVNTDITSGLEKRLAGSVDVLVVNPPYVPTPEDEVGCEGITSAWAGGENGRSVIDKILPAADNLLSDRGWLYMVTLTANNPSEICLEMRKKGYASRIVLQRSTEEESLHIIKFWRDSDSQLELKNLNYWTKLVRN